MNNEDKLEVIKVIYRYLDNLEDYNKIDYSLINSINYDYLRIELNYHNFNYEVFLIEDYLLISLLDLKYGFNLDLKVFNLNRSSFNDILIFIKNLIKFYP